MLFKSPSDFEAACLSTESSLQQWLMDWPGAMLVLLYACCSAQDEHLEMTLKQSVAKLMKYGPSRNAIS